MKWRGDNLWNGGLIRALVVTFATLGAASAPAQTASNLITFTESLHDKVVCAMDVNGAPSCDTQTSGRFLINATISLAGVDITQFDVDTPFELSIGGLTIDNLLGDDPHFVTNRTAATFIATGQTSNGKTVVGLTVHLVWNAQMLRVKAVGKTPDLQDPILADLHEDDSTGPVQDTTSANVILGDASVTFATVTVGGRVVTRNAHTKDGSDVGLFNIHLQGAGAQ